jgi:hypothetical protein
MSPACWWVGVGHRLSGVGTVRWGCRPCGRRRQAKLPAQSAAPVGGGLGPGAVEIGEADIGDGVIDQGLALIRTLWDAGIAHRDIKPGNLMVRSGELLLIDVAFVQVRPSPWRQAVDLGNMMLVLACRTDPERVYQRALAYFTPDELAEAFAATRGVASPTQLRAFMKRDPRDLLGEFRGPRGARKTILSARLALTAGENGPLALPSPVVGVVGRQKRRHVLARPATAAQRF